MTKAKFKIAEAQASARDILIGLGVKRSLIPDPLDISPKLASAPVDAETLAREQIDHHPYSKEAQASRPKRRRRTKEQMKQLRKFTEWQFR